MSLTCQEKYGDELHLEITTDPYFVVENLVL